MATDEERRRVLEHARALINRPYPALRPRPAPAPDPAELPTWTGLDHLLSPIHWDWPGWLPRGFLTILAGDPGAGKSLLALHLAAVYLNRLPWPDGAPFTGDAARPAVIWCEAESSHALNLERARRWDLDLERILSPVKSILRNFSLAERHSATTLLALALREDVGLVVVDSLRGLRLGSRPTPIRSTLTIFAEIARLAHKPLILTHHLRKSRRRRGDPPALEHLLGAGAIAQVARVIWAVDLPDPARPAYRRLSILKNNLAPFPDPLGFHINAAGLHFGPPPQPTGPETARDRALAFLRAQLAAGPLPSSDLYDNAEAAGLSPRTLRRAKKQLAARAFRPPGQTRWYWKLPEKK